jgi:predicted CoA-binding protein
MSAILPQRQSRVKNYFANFFLQFSKPRATVSVMAKLNKAGRNVITVKPAHHRTLKSMARKSEQTIQKVVDGILSESLGKRKA